MDGQRRELLDCGLFLKWGPGPTRSRILAHLHRPEDCLPGAGYKLRADRGAITIKVKDLLIPFRALDFDIQWAADVRLLLPLAGSSKDHATA